MSPYLQRPLELGADIIIHSATKFIGGHSDVIAGFAVTNSKKITDEIYKIQNGFGAILSAQDCYLVSRGLKTLKIRMDESQKNAIKLAEWLEKQEIVENVVVAVSLGAVETIVSYPVKMSHAAIPKDKRERLGITDTLIRVSLGIEDIEDIILGFEKAFLKDEYIYN